MRLSDLAIRQLPFTQKGQVRYRDATLPGFGVTVGTSTKTFFVMYGETRRLRTIGRYPDISLREARGVAKGILAGPAPKNRSERLSAAREAFLDDCRTRLRPTTVERYHYALKDIADGPLDAISTNVTDPNQLKALKALYNWCIDHQLTDRNPFVRRKVRFAVRERLLTDEEITALWEYDHYPYSHIVKLLILTGQRRNQIWRYNPAWNDGEAIHFPSAVMKNGTPHTIPVTGYARFLPNEPFSFNSWSKAKLRMDKHTGVTDYVLHDIRRYFSTTMAKLGVPLHVTEQIIDHRSQVTGVAAIYNRYSFLPEMKTALETYERHLATIVAPKG